MSRDTIEPTARSHRNTIYRKLSTCLVLIALGTFSNKNTFDTFPSLGISLASIFTIYAAINLGPLLGALVSTFSFIPTLFIWEQPLALVSAVLESIVYGYLRKRYKLPPISCFFLYWVFLGLPIIYLGAVKIANLAWPMPLLLLIKYPLNSLLSLLIALILTRIDFLRKLTGSEDYTQPQRLRNFIVSNYFAAIFLPPVVLVTIAGFMTLKQTGQIQFNSVKTMSGETARDLSVTFSFLKRSMSTLAVELSHREPGAHNDLLAQHLRSYSIFSTVEVTNTRGEVIHQESKFNEHQSTSNTPPSQTLANRTDFLVPRATGKPYLSDAFVLDEFGKSIVIAVSAPVYDSTGSFSGVVVGSVLLSALPQLPELIESDPDYSFYLIDSNCRLVASNATYGPALMTNMRTYTGMELKQVPNAKPQLYEVNSISSRRRDLFLGCITRLPDQDWYILRERSVSSLVSLASESFSYGLFWAAIACTVAICAAQMISHQLTTPFKAVLDGNHEFNSRDTPIELAELCTALVAHSRARENAIADLKEALEDRDEVNSELKRFSEELEKNVTARTAELAIERDRAAEASRIKSDFIANVSHEFRTPLNVILGNVQLMQLEQKSPSENGKREKRLHQISASCELLRRQVDEILDLAKIESNAMDLDLRLFDLGTLVTECAGIMSTSAQIKSIEILTILECTQPEIIADRHRLTQIVINLLSNAIKFTPRGGRVEIAMAESTQDRNIVIINVRDNGAGMTNEEQARMFEPFTRGTSANTTGESGTGLGLPLVRQLVALHDGHISVSSEMGTGSCFTISLPKAGPSLKVTPSRRGAQEGVKQVDFVANPNKRPALNTPDLILIAEDYAPNAELIEELLISEGFQTKIAKDGAEAVQMALDCFPRLILMDWRMPVLNGDEAVRQIRANPDTAKIPIIALTGVTLANSHEVLTKQGPDMFLIKPIDSGKLISSVINLLKPPQQGKSKS